MEQSVLLKASRALGETLQFGRREIPEEDRAPLGGLAPNRFVEVTNRQINRPCLLVAREGGELRLV